MLYTLAKFFGWGLGFAVIGGVIGWLLRGIRCSRELAAAKRTTVDLDEVDRLRHRVANLEPIVADRDSLRARVASLETELKSAKGAAASAPPAVAAAATGFADLPGAEAAGALDQAGAIDTSVDTVPAEEVAAEEVAAAPEPVAAVPEHDAAAAKAVLGKAIALDDLKVVEGIGPVLEGVLHRGGVTTWAQLATTAPDRIKEILLAADDRHRMHDPSTWPRQAELASAGEWQQLKELQDRLSAGRG